MLGCAVEDEIHFAHIGPVVQSVGRVEAVSSKIQAAVGVAAASIIRVVTNWVLFQNVQVRLVYADMQRIDLLDLRRIERVDVVVGVGKRQDALL